MIPVRPINAPVNIQPVPSRQSVEMSSSEQLTDVTKSKASTISEFRDSGKKRYDDLEMHGRNRSENYQHPFDNTNIINPFPVPFLKRLPKLSKARVAAPETTITTDRTSANNRTFSEQTLPPSIVVASNVQGFDYTTSAQKTDRNHYTGKNSVENTKEVQESGEQIFFDLDSTER